MKTDHKLDDGTHCDEAREVAEQKLEDVRAKLDDLRRIESVLAHLVELLRRGPGNHHLSDDPGAAHALNDRPLHAPSLPMSTGAI